MAYHGKSARKFIGVTGGGNPMFWYELHDVEEALAGLGENSKRRQSLKGQDNE